MNIITTITADPLQKQGVILSDGTKFTMQMRFCPMQFCWFIDTLTYGSFTLNGIRIVNTPNLLRQFKNNIPFGMACFSNGSREPSQQQDFSSGASSLLVLTSAEVAQYEAYLSGK